MARKSHTTTPASGLRRSYKFRLRPTKGQHQRLNLCLEAHRELYNAALEERRSAYERVVLRSAEYFGPERPKVNVSYVSQAAQLVDIRAGRPDIASYGYGSEQATLRRLDKAFQAFFRRVKRGEAPGYPRFKPAHRFDSVEWPKDGDGCKWHQDTKRVYLKGVGHIKATVHREVRGSLKTIEVKREGNKWYLVLSCDDVPAKPLPATGKEVGIDVGIANFAALSTGEIVDNPRYAKVEAKVLADAQRRLSLKTKGSNNRQAARQTVAKSHRKVKNQRLDFHHKTALKLVTQYDVICAEKLNIKGMTRKPKPLPGPQSPGNFLPTECVVRTRRRNKAIQDAGWAQFRSILEAKAEEAGRRVVSVDPQHTSQMCAECGHIEASNRVKQAVFKCQQCGHEAHADINAARNILRAGLALPAAQAA